MFTGRYYAKTKRRPVNSRNVAKQRRALQQLADRYPEDYHRLEAERRLSVMGEHGGRRRHAVLLSLGMLHPKEYRELFDNLPNSG